MEPLSPPIVQGFWDELEKIALTKSTRLGEILLTAGTKRLARLQGMAPGLAKSRLAARTQEQLARARPAVEATLSRTGSHTLGMNSPQEKALAGLTKLKWDLR